MMQGRKSRTVLALGCALAMLAAVAAIAPALAGAQGAVEEYDLGTLPEPDSDEPNPQSGGNDESDPAVAPATAGSGSGSDPTATAPVTEAEGEKNQGGRSDGGSDGSGSGARNADDGGLVASATGDGVPDVSTDSSDGGGTPILLIALAVIAAVCTGLAVWRLRRTAGDSAEGAGRGATGASKVSSETQSL
jgi:cobalamin biosynthesis Mg chelatase CobN